MQDSKTIRRLDRSLGKWLCKLISPWVRWRSRQNPSSTIKRVLLIELFEMGSAVMLIPSIDYLIRTFPDLEIHVLTTSMCDSVWRELDPISESKLHVIQARSAPEFIASTVKTLWSLKNEKFDLIIDYSLFMRAPALLSAFFSASHRAGFYKYAFEGLERGNFYDRMCSFNQNSHISKNFLALTMTAAGPESDTPNLKHSISEEDIRLTPLPRFSNQKNHLQNPTIVICPDVGPTLSVRNYPLRHWIRALQVLRSQFPKHEFIFLGTAENQRRVSVESEGASLLSMGKNLMGKTDFPELLALIQGADLLICNDHGPAHFAALTGTKTLALFSTDSPFMYGPLGDAVIAYKFFQCSPCISALNHKSTVCSNNLCLQSLSPETVANLAATILNGHARYRTINNEISYLPSLKKEQSAPLKNVI